jgi:hypothetical protein
MSNEAKTRAPRKWTADRVRGEAAKEYAKGTPLPEAIRRIDNRAKRPTIALVSPVYWRLAGESDPIPGKNDRARNAALRKRRNAGTRFEVLAASLAVALGRSVAKAEVLDRLRKAGLDPDASYTGRGTRKSPAGEAARVERGSAK